MRERSPFTSQQAGRVIVRSPAKLNLFLEVTGRRSDGFHELVSVMVRTSICDEIQFAARPDGQIEVREAVAGIRSRESDSSSWRSGGFPVDETNLMVRAARRLQQRTETHWGVTMTVRKRVPMQAGLGGGSSNAATTLQTLNQLWGVNCRPHELHAIAAELGSDINFLLSGYRSAVCRGRGEQIQPVARRGRLHGVLVVPDTGNSTKEVFDALDGDYGAASPDRLVMALERGQIAEAQNCSQNRLQRAAGDLNPLVLETLRRLRDASGHALLTGSGSGCFAIVPSARRARQLAVRLRRRHDRLVAPFDC